ncbi:cadherin-like domain-containing protein, partial [Candidatus Accumulibacter vicinus]
NQAPIADNETYSIHPGQTLAVAAPGVLEGDTDADGDALSVTSVDITGLKGSLSAFADGHFSFTPTAGFIGATSFKYNVSDGHGGAATGTVNINVVNHAPVADNDTYSMRPGQTLAIAAPGVLEGDTDADGDALSVTSVDITGLKGSLSAFADGHFSFTPTAGFVGATAFKYNISDGHGGVATGTVNINVGNRAPDANADEYSVHAGRALTVAAPGLLANDKDPDGDSLSVSVLNVAGLSGKGVISNPRADGSFTFTPNAGFAGDATFSYTISDGFGGSATATALIHVGNAAPVAVADAYSVHVGRTLAIAAPGLLANDSDPDGDSLQVISLNVSGLQGSLSPFADGHFSFTPTAGFTGTTSFNYTISDGFGGTSTATVKIDVFNNKPVVNNDTYTIRPNQVLSVAAPGLLANDSDPDGDTLSVITLDVSGLQGSISPFADGHFSFTPTTGFAGTTSFKYTVSDGVGGTATGTTTINVVNTAPVATNDSYTVHANNTLSIAAPGLLANDSDPDGDSLQVIS